MNAKITRARTSDFAAVAAILAEYAAAIDLPDPDDCTTVGQYLREPCGFWLATVNRTVAGCVGVRPLHAGALELKRLYVRQAYRGRGLADALLDAAQAFARNDGATWLYLDSTEDLVAALSLYRRRGFRDCPRYNDDANCNVFMRLQL